MLTLAQDAGVSYLYITHDLAVARYMCDRIAVMHRGVLGRARPAAEWSEHALLEEATRGTAREAG